MKNQLSKLSLVLIGFIGGVAFLINCGGGGDTTTVSIPGLPEIPVPDLINEADAGALPVISDQMLCYAYQPQSITDENQVDMMRCMKQSTKVQELFDNLSGIYAEGWILINFVNFSHSGNLSSQSNIQYLFYK